MILTSFSRWTTKPPPGTNLDVNHPLCPDYCWPFLSPQGTQRALCKAPILKDSSLKSQMYVASSSMVPGGKYGLSRRRAGTAASLYLAESIVEVDRVVGTTQGFTLLIAHKHTSGNQGAIIGVDTATAAQQLFVLLPWSDSTVGWVYGSSAAGSVSIPLSSLTLGDDLWMFTAGNRGVEMWQNGILRAATTTGVPTRNTGATLFKMPAWTAGNDFFGDTALIMTWRRELPQAALKVLSENPWQVFQPSNFLALDTVGAPPTAVGTPDIVSSSLLYI